MQRIQNALMQVARGFWRFAGDVGGNILPLAAGGILVMAGLVGGAVDMSRAYNVDNRLQAACDAGALAGRRAVQTDGFDDDAEEQANSYFYANFNEEEQEAHDTVFTATSEDEGNTINATASTTVDHRIMRIFGIDEMELTATCSASMGIGNSDVMFVLDNTGSMAWTPEGDETEDDEEKRIYALQQAMKAFYDTVAASNAGSNARIRYGFVPYSSTVNVGALLMAESSSYVANTMTISTRRPVKWSAVVETWTGTDTTTPESGDFSQYTGNTNKYDTLSACNSAKPADGTTFTTYDTDTTTTKTFYPNRGTQGQKVTATGDQEYQRKADYECIYRDGKASVKGYYVNRSWITREFTSYVYEARDLTSYVTTYDASFHDWLYGAWPVDVSTYKTGDAQLLVRDNGSVPGRTRWNTTSTWAGCIQERKTTPADSFSFVSLDSGIDPEEALDLDIDAAPTSDNDTKWKPLWPSATFRRYTVETSLQGTSSSTACPYQAQLLTTMSKEAFDGYVDDLEPTGSTYHDIGLLWGARLSSPTGIFADNVNDEPDNAGTVSRHLIFMTDGELQPSNTTNSAYGIEFTDRRVTVDGSNESQDINHRARYLAICEAIKARGIRLWVIAFGAGVELSTDLVACSSTDPEGEGEGKKSAFKADNAAELNKHFQEIAKQVGELRVIQ